MEKLPVSYLTGYYSWNNWKNSSGVFFLFLYKIGINGSKLILVLNYSIMFINAGRYLNYNINKRCVVGLFVNFFVCCFLSVCCFSEQYDLYSILNVGK